MLSLRRATAGDAPLMARVAEEAYAPYVERMGGQRPWPMDVDYDAAVAEDQAWVCEQDGQVVGFVVLVREADGMLLDNVAVRPVHQGRGAGRALLTLAEERARAAGCDRLRLYTHVTMVENRALYERIGYVETDSRDESGFARVFFEKVLA